MRTNITRFSALAALSLVVFFADSARADNEESSRGASKTKECAQLIKECYTLPSIEKTNCFYTSAKDAACDNTDLGRIANKRWSISTVNSSDLDGAPAFLGPSTNVDKECVNAFDKDFQANLQKGEIADETLTQLQTKLEACKKQAQVNIPRP